jgi:hypothetical protein
LPPPIRAPLVPLLALVPAILAAQGRAFELQAGRWYNGNRAGTYELRSTTPLGAYFSRGLSLTALVSDSLGRRRAFYGAGYQLEALRARSALAPYVLAGVALGLSTDTSAHELGMLWTVGTGLEWRPFARFGLGVEAQYRLEDRGPRGFWRAEVDARRGVSASLGFSIGGGRRATTGGGGRFAPLPPPAPPEVVSGNAASVVETALGVLGTPYQWGGTAENGFDCSGLIQYAYGQHGIRLPRRGRDQAGAGAEVTPVVDALRPGDILLFSAHPDAGVTHVGMYVGEGKFIHSSASGVKLSRLNPQDPDGAYWIARWVGARRMIP